MCGIAGFLGPNGDPREAARGPLASLAHRGPDDAGWVARTSPACLLLHRRLSILDLSAAGHQPMFTPDGSYTIVFNGEIYNYCELREELARLGVNFRTQTDTEVLLHAYVRWGAACLRRLTGMFAFAIEDQRRRVLFLARDFFGIKPLYHVAHAGGFAFASEIKTLLDWLPIPRTVDPQRLYDYLRFGRTDHGAATMWSAIQQVPAAHYLEVSLDRPIAGQPVRYWRLPDDETLDVPFDEAARRVREAFLQNIRLHLRSDVPVGAALSGGIDSSAIVAAMRAVESGADLHAFSYIADEPAMSEERWVDLVGTQTSAAIHKVLARPDDLVADLDRLIYTQDEPFGSTSIYAQYRVFRLAREKGIKVMLDGQGADEMLAGYRQNVPARLSSLIRQGRLLDAFAFGQKAAQLPGMSGRVRMWLQALRLLMPETPVKWLNEWLVPSWLDGRWFRERGVSLHAAVGSGHRDKLREELRQTLTATSLPMLLRYEDRNSMASSIESRVPFLTPDFAELVLRLPEQHILSNDGTTKNVFRQAMRGIVPDAILDRRDKIGFATPEQRWLTHLRPWVDAALSSDRARSLAALDLPTMTRDWQAVHAGKAPFDFRIWRWVNLIRWADRFNAKFS